MPPPMLPPDEFSAQVLDWHARHGRHDLPWQRNRTPYRVWVSEVMLQQTQVATVVGYFDRFVARFPGVAALARASLDEVLALWSGLGYYSRGRNLHTAATRIMGVHGGELPRDPDALAGLPGIGRSTAAAILALAHGDRHAILDGNVKRVLARYHAIDGWPGAPAVARALWSLAESHTPDQHVAEYTQGIMDLGATVCVRQRPRCEACPVAGGCSALALGRVADLPAPRPARFLPEIERRCLILERGDGALWLERRPPTGVWGGLWSLPELGLDENPADWLDARAQPIARLDELPPVRHGFTHFRLTLHPVRLAVATHAETVADGDRGRWFAGGAWRALGLPAPIRRMLESIPGGESGP